MNIPILLYHSVSNQVTASYRPWAMSLERFEAHMLHLREQGYHPLTISQAVQAIHAGGSLPERPVAITFDDGMADFVCGAVPILQKYRFPATLYITTGYVGGTSHWLTQEGEENRPMLSWEEIAALGNVELGAHSHTHAQLDIIPFADAQNEIVYSKKLLEQHLKTPVQSFAFPHGYHTQKLMNLVKLAGYTSACAVGHAMATTASDVFALPRIMITSDVTVSTLAQFLQGEGLRDMASWRTVLRTAWRLWRRMTRWAQSQSPAFDRF